MHVALFPNLLSRVRPVFEIVAVARTHFGRLPLAVASCGDQLIVEMTLERVGIRTLFDHVVAIGTVCRGKPAPDLFLAASERLGVAPETCHVYEDSDEGLEAASRAGMSALDVREVPGLTR
ncbi:haloacid dehalogenase superfamily, subfamily IA, variant 3 with third motif having DD or ED [Celeribacter baekdonensis]|uniref:Haloacid dehalogenase superfamily, subfamily IA, variant 3 with third motif having DD or ED n=2 Tax=Celeribacter baekdonensis TaxID=875171 RepID=A0A1G7QUH7_9RHOB|nr:haloacid dehalogenase superfamily, subfamily IA, variant 3 with third motif having DD or ED [Celeribacter baekdonensis]